MIPLLITVGVVALLVAMFLAPMEALSWWAGWFGGELKSPPTSSADTPKRSRAKHYVIFLDGIAKIGSENYEDVQGLLDNLARRNPEAVLMGDIMPYSMTNTGLLDKRPMSRFWRYAYRLKREGKRPVIAFTINIRNVLQVLVSADERYGPLYSQGEAQSILNKLVGQGYEVGSGVPVTLIGYSGGGQIALGVTPLLKRALAAPVTVISLGGVMSSDPGLADADHLYHLVGSKDPVPNLGRLFPGRWPLLVNSHWNQMTRQGRFSPVEMGPMTHNGVGSYLDEAYTLASGESFLAHTSGTLTSLFRRIEEQQKKLSMSAKPAATRANVDKKLKLRLRLYSLIFLVMLGVVVYNLVTGGLSLWLGLSSLGAGVLIGVFMSRMFSLSWDEQESVVIGRIDWIGGAILAAYILFALGRNWLFGLWVSGPALGAFTLSFFAGNMLGRVVGTVVGIRHILKAWGLDVRGGSRIS